MLSLRSKNRPHKAKRATLHLFRADFSSIHNKGVLPMGKQIARFVVCFLFILFVLASVATRVE